MLQSILINGFVCGGMYSILAVGFSLVFGVANILNMAHTSFYMVASFFIFIATFHLGFPLIPSAIMAVLLIGVVGVVCYRLFFNRTKQQGTAVMIISIGLALFFQEIFMLIFGASFHGISPFFSGFIEIMGVKVTNQYIFAMVVSLFTLIGIWIMLSKTKLGNTIRAVSQESEAAELVGINVSQICMIIVGISAALAGIAGVITAPIYLVNPAMWVQPLVIVLAAVVLGGVGSVKGSVIASFILGFAETIVVFLIPGGSFLRGAISLSVLVLVLVIRPEGLFGVVFEEERL